MKTIGFTLILLTFYGDYRGGVAQSVLPDLLSESACHADGEAWVNAYPRQSFEYRRYICLPRHQ